jgi:flavin-binding protein dodecin
MDRGSGESHMTPRHLLWDNALAREEEMRDHVYKVVELVGSSEMSIDDAVKNGVARAAETLRNLRWFEVIGTRGEIRDGHVSHYQVTLKVGFTLE